MKSDNSTTIEELKNLVVKFRNDRNWHKAHNPRNLATSISVEAAELLEHFQWGEYDKNNKRKIEEELADVLIYCFNLADTLNIDISEIFKAKIKAAEEKYPLSVFGGNNDNPEEYKKIRKTYRENKK